MLDKIDMTHTLSKKGYKNEIGGLETKLAELQRKIKDLKIPVVIVFEGWSASGKGTCISKILNPLDPRYYSVYTMDKIPEEAAMRPFLWDYWIKTPEKGRITIFDKSWHRAALPERQAKRPLSLSEAAGFYYDLDSFERQLSDDGVLIVKFFLHISKSEQKKRFDELLDNPDTEWRVDKQDILQNKNYEKHFEHFENMIRQSNFAQNEWNIIEADDLNYATIKIYKILTNKIENEIRRGGPAWPPDSPYSPAENNVNTNENNEIAQNSRATTQGRPYENHIPPQTSILSSINPEKDISQEEYKEKLNYYQKKLSYLGYKLYAKRRPVVIVYEGWDAAGKGGNIRRLTQRLDPRGYAVMPVAAPTQEELAHHYLWRFWKSMPKDGHIAIFDRSWYGRVLVERVEGFCTDIEWQRAYKEINDMETHLYNHGTVIFKFWLHIDKDEQLKRFQMREADMSKQHKMTDEDWRNRDKWELYEKAADEMLLRTNTDCAPWTVVESNNKKFARIKTLKLVVETLESELK